MANKLLMIGYVWPEPRSSAAGVRDLALLEIFRDAGFAVTYASPARESDAKRELESLGFATLPIAANDPGFDERLGALGPDVVVFGRFVYEEQFGWRVRRVCPDALRVLDTVDLHFLRKARLEWLRAGVPLEEIFERVPNSNGDECLRELASIHRSDLVFLCSDFERALLAREFGVAEEGLALASFFYPDSVDTAGFAGRSGFVSVGNFRHEPNLDATFWLKRELWPLIRACLPGARVELFGAYPPREVMALTQPDEGFVVRGQEPGDILPVLARFRVNLAALRFGAGIKGKIAEGWRAGTPCVTTPIGAEGMRGGPRDFFGGLIGTSAEELAGQAVRLHEREPDWQEASERGRAIVRERLARASNGTAVVAAVEGARANLRLRRARNVTGQLLWHQGQRSTEYFSRWIEAKNRLSSPPA